jgi:hypothetical protein
MIGNCEQDGFVHDFPYNWDEEEEMHALQAVSNTPRSVDTSEELASTESTISPQGMDSPLGTNVVTREVVDPEYLRNLQERIDRAWAYAPHPEMCERCRVGYNMPESYGQVHFGVALCHSCFDDGWRIVDSEDEATFEVVYDPPVRYGDLLDEDADVEPGDYDNGSDMARLMDYVTRRFPQF